MLPLKTCIFMLNSNDNIQDQAVQDQKKDVKFMCECECSRAEPCCMTASHRI